MEFLILGFTKKSSKWGHPAASGIGVSKYLIEKSRIPRIEIGDFSGRKIPIQNPKKILTQNLKKKSQLKIPKNPDSGSLSRDFYLLGGV